MASSTFMTGGSTWYFTSIRDRASSAMWGLVAATAATACPLYSTLSAARQLLLINFGLDMAPSPRSAIFPEGCGRSAEVTTALTPGIARARLASMERMRAWGWGLLRVLAWRSPGNWMSAPYWALPVTLSVPSWRMGLVPTTSYSWVDSTMLEVMGLSPPCRCQVGVLAARSANHVVAA